MSIKFEKGQTYNTVKTLGVMRKGDGRLQITQHTGKDGPDIDQAEKLTFDGREAGKLWFLREDGTRVCGHRSHFDPADAYNTAKGEGKSLENAKAKMAKKQAELAEAQKKLESVMETIEAEDFSPVSADDRSAAAELFAE